MMGCRASGFSFKSKAWFTALAAASTVADNSVPPLIKKANLAWCSKQIYGAHSKYVHAGKPFPARIGLGLRARVPGEVMTGTTPTGFKLSYGIG